VSPSVAAAVSAASGAELLPPNEPTKSDTAASEEGNTSDVRLTAMKPRAVKMEMEEADTSVYESTRIHEVNEIRAA